MSTTCPRCGSEKIIPGVPLPDHYDQMGQWSNQAEVDVEGAPRAWVFKDSASGQLSLDICGACGHADLRVSNFRDLYEKYARSLGQ